MRETESAIELQIEARTSEGKNVSTVQPSTSPSKAKVSPLAVLLAVACSVLFILLMHYRKTSESAREAGRQLSNELVKARQQIAQLRPQARLADPKELPKLRDAQYDFVISNYGFEYEGRTGDLIDEQILMYGLWEKGLAFFMRDYLVNCEKGNGVLVDVGCNVGQHSLFLAQYVSQVHSFDPYLPALERFQSMIQRNGMTNIAIHAVGLGEEDAELPYFVPHEGNFGSGTFNGKWGSGTDREELKLKIVRGDDWFAEKGIHGITLIKIDIEGYEAFALKGLRKTLESERPVLFIEVSSGPDAEIKSLDELKSLFPENYEFTAVVEYIWTTRVDGKYITTAFDEQSATSFFASPGQAMIAAYPREKKDLIPQRPLASE